MLSAGYVLPRPTKSSPEAAAFLVRMASTRLQKPSDYQAATGGKYRDQGDPTEHVQGPCGFYKRLGFRITKEDERKSYRQGDCKC